MKKFLSLILCLTCVLWCIPEFSFADEELPPLMDNYEIIEIGNDDDVDLTQEEINRYPAQDTSLPEEYDLRDVEGRNYVTSVKNQGNYGTCWAFSACAAMESNLLMDGYGEYDFSELQLAYFTYNNPTVVREGLEGDYTRGERNYLDGGGNPLITTSVLAKKTGLTDEENAPYSAAHYGKSLKDSLEHDSNTAEMVNCDWISMMDRDRVKELLMEKGAAGTGMYVDTNYQNRDNHAYYIDEQGYKEEKGGGHAVTIVGWNDNFSKENFGAAPRNLKPENDGAWLIKNSWGTDNWFNEEGYFWMSYYDYYLCLNDASFYDARPASEAYDNVKQYDGANSHVGYTLPDNKGYRNKASYMANVFKSNNHETLKAVGFTTFENDMDYSIDIYTNVTDSNDPTSGKKVWSSPQSGTITAYGYHTIDLSSPVDLKKGEKYSVVVALKNANSDVSIPLDMDYDGWSWVYFNASSKAGQSYISADGENWEDIGDSGDTNVKVKAFTDNTKVVPAKVSGMKQSNTTTTKFTLKWNKAANATGYQIYRYNTKTKVYDRIKTVSASQNSYTVTGLKAGSSQKYKVRAYAVNADLTGYGTFSNAYSAVTRPAKTSVKATPMKSKAKISWSKVNGASGYVVYMSSNNGKSYKKIGTYASSKSNCTKSSLKKGKTYRFKVKAYKSANGVKYYGTISKSAKCKVK